MKVWVTLTIDEYAALARTVRGELESLTDQDEASGVYDDLTNASAALRRGWHNYRARYRRDERIKMGLRV